MSKKVNNTNIFDNHTFAICAFKKNEYIEICIRSILRQTIHSNLIICTSTPNSYIKNIAHKYGIPLFKNKKKKVGMINDRIFALKCCKTQFVTICDQDDVYAENYLESILPILSKKKYSNNVLYVHTGYNEIDEKGIKRHSIVVFIKRMLLLSSKLPFLQKYYFFKRLAICFGNTVCDASCAYNIKKMGTRFYSSSFKTVFDWDLRYKCAIKPGAVYYVSKRVFFHRISCGKQATSIYLKTGIKQKEDLAMFEKMWPRLIAKIIFKFYTLSYKIYS